MRNKPRFNIADVFNDELFDEPRREGVAEGKVQGERLALEELLRDALAGKVVAAELDSRIAQADNSQLRAWVKSLIAGAGPQQIFAAGR